MEATAQSDTAQQARRSLLALAILNEITRVQVTLATFDRALPRDIFTVISTQSNDGQLVKTVHAELVKLLALTNGSNNTMDATRDLEAALNVWGQQQDKAINAREGQNYAVDYEVAVSCESRFGVPGGVVLEHLAELRSYLADAQKREGDPATYDDYPAPEASTAANPTPTTTT